MLELQIRHARLWQAGRERATRCWRSSSWPKCARPSTAWSKPTASTPRCSRNKLSVVLPAMVDPALAQLQAAVDAKDAAKLEAGYDALTAGCNGCHAAAGARLPGDPAAEDAAARQPARGSRRGRVGQTPRCRGRDGGDGGTREAQLVRLHLGRPRACSALLGVLCFHFPELLTSREFRADLQEGFARQLLLFGLVAAFVLGTVAILRGTRPPRRAGRRRQRRRWRCCCGGATVHFDPIDSTPYLARAWTGS